MKYLIAIICGALLSLTANAGGKHVTVNHYHVTQQHYEQNTYVEEGVSNNELDGVLAGSIAASQIQCNTSSRKHQAGIGLGYRGGENAGALGYCHKVGDSSDYSQTLGGTVILISGQKPAYGLGYNVTW